MNDILKQLRVRTGLTQEKLAEELNVAPTTVQNWEKGDKIPPDALNNLVSFYRFGSNVINNLVIALYGDGSFKNLDEILCEEKKDLSILILDSGNKWRSLLKYLNPEKVGFFSLSNIELNPVCLNPLKIPYGVNPQTWVENIIKVFSESYSLNTAEKQTFSKILYTHYMSQGVFPQKGSMFTEEEKKQFADWDEELSRRSGLVTFLKIYKDCHGVLERSQEKWNTVNVPEAAFKLHDLLSCFSRPYSTEYLLYSAQKDFSDPNAEGVGKDIAELLEEKEVIVLEGCHTDSPFVQFICGFIQSVYKKNLCKTDKETILVSDIHGQTEIISNVSGNMSDKELGKILMKI
jgi:transcriptional regulator with XRE-family HTH domain